ncbi:hypothetical protein JXA12_02400 [Candidatus Woesearchaeota archaeon]|nr:hypothetical protein [Candidatus Woesearchaeota archaeon]
MTYYGLIEGARPAPDNPEEAILADGSRTFRACAVRMHGTPVDIDAAKRYWTETRERYERRVKNLSSLVEDSPDDEGLRSRLHHASAIYKGMTQQGLGTCAKEEQELLRKAGYTPRIF